MSIVVDDFVKYMHYFFIYVFFSVRLFAISCSCHIFTAFFFNIFLLFHHVNDNLTQTFFFFALIFVLQIFSLASLCVFFCRTHIFLFIFPSFLHVSPFFIHVRHSFSPFSPSLPLPPSSVTGSFISFFLFFSPPSLPIYCCPLPSFTHMLYILFSITLSSSVISFSSILFLASSSFFSIFPHHIIAFLSPFLSPSLPPLI